MLSFQEKVQRVMLQQEIISSTGKKKSESLRARKTQPCLLIGNHKNLSSNCDTFEREKNSKSGKN